MRFSRDGGSKTLFHYTDEAGAKSIAETGVIIPDAKGRVYLTEDKLPATDTNNALFMDGGGEKGTHRVEVKLNSGSDMSRGTQPNEMIHNGSIRMVGMVKLR